MATTPGPWKTVRDNFISRALFREMAPPIEDDPGLRIVFSERQGDIAYVVPADDDNGNANARLIAAAPALQANLRLAIWHLEHPSVPITKDAMANLKLALAHSLPPEVGPDAPE